MKEPTELFPPGARIGNYTIEGLLVQPTMCSYVFTCQNETDSGKYVFKYIRPTMKPEQVQMEIEMNQSLQHCPNAVVGFDFVEVYGSFGYFMDNYTRGDLLDFVQLNTLSEENVRNMSFRILEALHYMHSAGFVHRDVKPENIFLDGDGGEPDAYLADFGLAAVRPTGVYLTDPVGSVPYCAPELHANQPYTEAVDMWAFGVTVYIMLTGCMPFPDSFDDRDEFLCAVQNGRYNDAYLVDVGCSDHACDLIHRLLQPDPDMRMTAAQALEHPFYASLSDLEGGIKQDVSLIETALTSYQEYDDF